MYRPGNFSGGGATTPCAFAIGIFVSDTVRVVAIMAGFVAATFALSLMLTCLVLSFALENMAHYLFTPFGLSCNIDY